MYLYGCAAVAVFILLVACINYMNLATARATRRARSVGIRKILGASRASLAMQFLGEAIGFSLVALVIGVALVKVALAVTPLNALMDHQVTLDLLHDPALAGWLLGLGVLMGLLAGAYPAIYLSSWAPLTALTGRYLSGKGTLRVREGLVVLQFTISAAVIAATLLMAAQMRYVAAKDLGFKKENRLVVTLRGLPTLEKIPTIRTELSRDSHILGISQVNVMLGQSTDFNRVQIEGNNGVMEPTQLAQMPIGEEFVQVMGLQLLQGRDFSQHLLTDIGTNVLVNEALVSKMGWTEPLGKQVKWGTEPGHVIGVVRDFNFKSLHTFVEPFLMYPLNTDYSDVGPIDRPFMIQKLVLNISGEDLSQTVAFVERVVQQADPRHPFEFEFLDAQLDKLYKDEHQLTRLTGIFAGICIFIACLGLFGLAAFATEQRTREIGTRKVLGATSTQIILLLARRILLLVAIASVLASVIAYFAVEQWLTGFAYRAGINFFIFVLAATSAAAVTFITVALQSYKTASADPVEALRHV
jgi:putative ABC transport system permease protein